MPIFVDFLLEMPNYIILSVISAKTVTKRSRISNKKINGHPRKIINLYYQKHSRCNLIASIQNGLKTIQQSTLQNFYHRACDRLDVHAVV